MYRVVMAAMALMLVLAACADGEPDSGADQTVSPTTATPTDEPNREPVDRAITDFAEHTGADSADVEVVADEQVTWRDGSLGCPEPGMAYTQALVVGYRIVLRAGGEEAFYHGASGEPPFRCDDPDPDGTIGGQSQ